MSNMTNTMSNMTKPTKLNEWFCMQLGLPEPRAEALLDRIYDRTWRQVNNSLVAIHRTIMQGATAEIRPFGWWRSPSWPIRLNYETRTRVDFTDLVMISGLGQNYAYIHSLVQRS